MIFNGILYDDETTLSDLNFPLKLCEFPYNVLIFRIFFFCIFYFQSEFFLNLNFNFQFSIGLVISLELSIASGIKVIK